jgi:archaeal flagellar protein FlaJ
MKKKTEKPLIDKNTAILSVTASIFISMFSLYYWKSSLYSIVSFFITITSIFVYFYFRRSLAKSGRIRRIESVFPDFLQLMSSNLRAGMTIDKAMLLSSRPEFAPLDEEILQTGRDITTSKNIEMALTDMAVRIESEKIRKTIFLIISGIKSGGDLSILLEETSSNMREREFLDKKAYSNVLMYVIFIFLIVAIFAPALFALSNVLVEVLTKILSSIPQMDTSMTATMPFSLSSVKVSIAFTNYFSILFIITIDILASLVLGLISKGEEKEGLKYVIPIIILSLSIFFGAKLFVSGFLAGLL